MKTAIEEHGIVDGLLPGPKRALLAWDWGDWGREELSLNVPETLHQACCGLRWRILWIKGGQDRLVVLGQKQRRLSFSLSLDCWEYRAGPQKAVCSGSLEVLHL